MGHVEFRRGLYGVDSGATLRGGHVRPRSRARHALPHPGVGSFLTGGNGVSSRTFVDIALGAGGVFAPERLIYTIKVLNNNGSTNWNMAGQFANNAQDEDETLAQAQIGANNEFDFFFGDWVSTFGADVNTLVTQRLSMDSFQLGLPQNQAFADFSNVTPNVTFTAAVPIPAALPLLATALGALGFAARRRRAAA